MKKNISYFMLLVLSIITACSNQSDQKASETNDTTKNVSDTTISKGDNAQDLDTSDVSFLQMAAYGGMVEVESSNKILQESKDTAIRTFASMMVKDHGAANAKLKSIASGKGYILPTALPQSKLDQIKKMDTFREEGRDEYYMQLMVAEHQNAIDLFSGASRSTDTAIANFAKSLLPKLKHHYQHTQKIDTALKAIKANQGDDPLKISNRKKQ